MNATAPQPDRLLLDIHGVEAMTNLSRRTIYRLMTSGDFPKPKAIPGLRAKRWTKGSILRWAERLCDAEDYASE